MSTLVNGFENTVCLNEVIDQKNSVNFYDIALLPGMFAMIRDRLLNQQRIPNRYNKDGNLTTNTMSDGQNLAWQQLDKKVDENVLIGSKINVPYLMQLDRIIFNRIQVVATIRHPVYALGSYQMPYSRGLNIANCTTDPRYKNFNFKNRDNIIQCQAELWNWFATVLYKMKDHITIFRYEDITEQTEMVLGKFADVFHLAEPKNIPKLSNKNIDSRYKRIDEVKEAVDLECPMMAHFNYSIG
jgi:hypothetical protein